MSFTRPVAAVLIGVVLGLTHVAAAEPVAPDMEQLTASAHRLASHGYCKAVAQIAGQVRTASESYYNSVFRSDAVILSCGALPGPNLAPPQRTPSQLQPQPPSVATAELAGRSGLTFDVEVGSGVGGFGQLSGEAQSYNVAAGIGVFVNPRLVIGLRGVIASGGPTNFTFTPPSTGFGIPSGPAVAQRGDPASQLAVVNLQRWYTEDVFYAFGAGIGRAHISPGLYDVGPATSSAALSVRVGLATPFGLELSCEVTAVMGANSQGNAAVLLGWQRF